MTLKRRLRRVHKWLALFVGLQVLAWTSGGFVMSFFDIQKVRGEHNIRESKPQPLSDVEILLPLKTVFSLFGPGEEILEIKLGRFLQRPVYRVAKGDGMTVLVDARTGEMLSPLSQESALRVAREDFAGDGAPTKIELVTEKNTEYRKDLPVWYVEFGDAENTHLYVSAQTGEILARRNKTWRLYDFFWMLHIMDYRNRTDFNHPLLVFASIIAVTMAVSGLVLLFNSFYKRDVRFIMRGMKK